LYNIVIEFGIPMQLVRPIKMCLNEIYSKVRLCKYLSYVFGAQNGLKEEEEEEALLPLFFNFALEYVMRKV